MLLNGITTCGITNDVFTILRSYAQEQAKSTMTRSATYFSVQSHLEVNKVHHALFFRIAELFPQDDFQTFESVSNYYLQSNSVVLWHHHNALPFNFKFYTAGKRQRFQHIR